MLSIIFLISEFLDFNRFPIYFFEFPDGYMIHLIFNFQVTNIYIYTSLLIPTCKLIHDPNNVNFDPEKSGIINTPSILFIPQLQYYMCSNVTGVYIRTRLRHLHDVSSPFRYLQISTGNSLKMRFCQHPSIEMSIEMYTNQNFLIFRICRNRLMFLQGVIDYVGYNK